MRAAFRCADAPAPRTNGRFGAGVLPSVPTIQSSDVARAGLRRASGREVPGVGVDFGVVGSVDAELLMVERVGPVAVLVEEDVVSSTEVDTVVDGGVAAVFPGGRVVDVAPGGDGLTSGPLAVG
jgi:hypothetical protein